MNIIKKFLDTIRNTKKEYVMLFALIAAVGLLMYSSMAVSQSWEDITLTTFYPAPFGQFTEVVAKQFRDFEDNVWRIDPSGFSRIQTLQVLNGIIAVRISGYGGAETAENNFVVNLGNGDSTLNDVHAQTFYQGDPGPLGSLSGDSTDRKTIRGRGKYIYGTTLFDISEGVIAGDCEIGDVVLISDNDQTDVMKSSAKFDWRIAGVISEDPVIYMGAEESNVPLALAGVVKCKATTENGEIERGDLLVSSSMPGHAMRAQPSEVKPGMLIGKAMQPLKEKTGSIYILVNKK